MLALGVLVWIVTMIRARTVNWSLTSDRLIEKRGLVASRRREMELADIRSVEVSKRVFQRLIGLGDVTIASAARMPPEPGRAVVLSEALVYSLTTSIPSVAAGVATFWALLT